MRDIDEMTDSELREKMPELDALRIILRRREERICKLEAQVKECEQNSEILEDLFTPDEMSNIMQRYGKDGGHG